MATLSKLWLRTARDRACVWRSATIGIAFLILSSGLTDASAAWSGFWTFVPSTGTWVWTWVWTVPEEEGFSANARPRGPDLVSAASSSTSISGEDCCGITIFDFGKLAPASIDRTGLLATDFVIDNTDGPDDSNLTLRYIGPTTLGPGIFLGLMTLADPTALPGSIPPVELPL